MDIMFASEIPPWLAAGHALPIPILRGLPGASWREGLMQDPLLLAGFQIPIGNILSLETPSLLCLSDMAFPHVYQMSCMARPLPP